jgi:hypothetical protein
MTALKAIEAGFEVGGAFLLAAEAIKTRNLRQLALRLRLSAIRALPIVRMLSGDTSAREPTLSWQASFALHVAVAIIGAPIWAFVYSLGTNVSAADILRHFLTLDPGWWGAVVRLTIPLWRKEIAVDCNVKRSMRAARWYIGFNTRRQLH